MDKLALRRGIFYEGDSQDLRAILPSPVISPLSCAFITPIGQDQVIFREDSFDPVTRIRRGRLYVGGRRADGWSSMRVDDGMYRPYSPYGQAAHGANWIPDASYDAWPGINIGPSEINGHVVQIGAYGYVTPWRIVGAELIATGHILFTLKANSLLGVVPELAEKIFAKDGADLENAQILAALNSLVDAFHRQQATPTVDVARETAKIILTSWIGQSAQGKDLAKVINEIPPDKDITKWSALIVNRFHSRGKSAAVESHASKGVDLRAIVDEDADACTHLVGLILREIGWTAV